MRVCRKMITAAAVVCVVAACSMFPAFAHGHCRDGASYRYPVCTEEGCQETGRHIHDGKTYCGYDKKFWYMGDAYLAVPSAEETDQLAQISNDIATYSNETLMKLCLGQYDLANIDEYINTLKELGLEDYVAIYQARHNRYMQAE